MSVPLNISLNQQGINTAATLHTNLGTAWGIQFNDRMTAGGFFANRLIAGRVVPTIQPGLEHADFALTAVRTILDEGIFVDRGSVGMLIGSTAGRAQYSPTNEAVQTALDRLETGLSEENAALAMSGYDALFQRMASDEEELKEMLAALQREATLATNTNRIAIAREMLIVGQMRLARIGNDATMAAGYTDYFLERISAPGLPAMARMLIAETVLGEWGDLLPLPVHVAGWDAMVAGMEAGAVLPAQARALLGHASTQVAHPEFRAAFGKIVTAWASRFQSDFPVARSSVAPNPEANALLSELVDICVRSGSTSELATLASIPVSNADIPWLLTVLEHAEPKVAADYFVRFAPEFDLRSSNLQLERCVYKKDLINTHLPQVAATIDNPALRWLLQVTLAALPNQPLTSPSDPQTSRERERRLADLADEHTTLDFESAPELEMAALRWFTEEPDVTKALAQAYARAGATIRPQDFARPLANSDTLVGKRRIVGTWLGQSLNQGPDSVIGFLDALPSPPESFDVAMTVGELMSSVHQAFDDESADWSPELRKTNLVVFRTLLARPELGRLNRAFSGRFAAVGLIRHAVEGEAQAFDATWSALVSPQRTALLKGADDFFRFFESVLRNASDGRSFSIAEMEATTRSINSSVIYQAMSDEAASGSNQLFKELLAANIATDNLICRLGAELILSNPRNGYAAEELAGIQDKAGQIDAALASWDVAIASVPETDTLRYTNAFLAKANLLERSARFADALEVLKSLDSKRLDKAGKAAFQNSLKELRILALSDTRDPQELLKFAASGLEIQPDSTQGRLSAAAVFRALRLKAQAAGNDAHAWAFGFLAAHTLAQLERDENDLTGGRLDSALQDFNAMHVGLGNPGGIVKLIAKGQAWRYTTSPRNAEWMQPSADDTSWLSDQLRLVTVPAIFALPLISAETADRSHSWPTSAQSSSSAKTKL